MMNPNYNIVNLGCGLDHHPNALNVDYDERKNPDQVIDLESQDWPFEDSQFNAIIANHILEHIEVPVQFMNNCWRILKPDGVLSVKVPHYEHPTAYEDTTHVNFFTEKSFQMFTHSTQSNSLTNRTWTIITQNIEWELSTDFPYWHIQKHSPLEILHRPKTIFCLLSPNKGD